MSAAPKLSDSELNQMRQRVVYNLSFLKTHRDRIPPHNFQRLVHGHEQMLYLMDNMRFEMATVVDGTKMHYTGPDHRTTIIDKRDLPRSSGGWEAQFDGSILAQSDAQYKYFPMAHNQRRVDGPTTFRRSSPLPPVHLPAPAPRPAGMRGAASGGGAMGGAMGGAPRPMSMPMAGGTAHPGF